MKAVIREDVIISVNTVSKIALDLMVEHDYDALQTTLVLGLIWASW